MLERVSVAEVWVVVVFRKNKLSKPRSSILISGNFATGTHLDSSGGAGKHE